MLERSENIMDSFNETIDKLSDEDDTEPHSKAYCINATDPCVS